MRFAHVLSWSYMFAHVVNASAKARKALQSVELDLRTNRPNRKKAELPMCDDRIEDISTQIDMHQCHIANANGVRQRQAAKCLLRSMFLLSSLFISTSSLHRSRRTSVCLWLCVCHISVDWANSFKD